MIQSIGAVIVTLFSAGCSSPPPADLKLVNVAGHLQHYDVYFDSNINFLALHAQNRHQKPVSTSFICSLDESPNFDPENDLHNASRGMIDFIGERTEGSKSTYRFRAHLLFNKIDPGTTRTQSIPSNAEVAALLAQHTQLSCKARILLYYGPAYYSDVLHIPSAKIRDLALELSRNEE